MKISDYVKLNLSGSIKLRQGSKLYCRPRKEYMKFLKDNGITYDGYQPINVKS